MISGMIRSTLGGPVPVEWTYGDDRPRSPLVEHATESLAGVFADRVRRVRIDRCILPERHGNVAVHLAGARVDKPLVVRSGQGLEQVHTSVNVGLDALVHPIPGLADVGVRPKVEHELRVGVLHQRCHGPAVVEVSSVQGDPITQADQPDRVDGRDRARQRMDLRSILDKAPGEMRSDEPGGSSDEDSGSDKFVHGPSPFRQRALNSSASL